MQRPLSRKQIQFIVDNKDTLPRRQIIKRLQISKRKFLDAEKYIHQEKIVPSTTKVSFFVNFFQSHAKLFKNKYSLPFVLFILSLLVRLFYLSKILPDPLAQIPIYDAQDYDVWAQAIAQGLPFRQTVYFTEPGYAYILAALYKFFSTNHISALFIQSVTGSFNAVFLYIAAKNMFGKLSGVITGLMTVFFVDFIIFDGLILKTSFEITLLCITVALLSVWKDNLTNKRLLALGVIIGLTTTIKANGVILIPILSFYLFTIFSKTKALTGSFLLILGSLIFILPVTYHNYKVGNDFVPLNYSGGPNVYIGNWIEADGTNEQPPFISALPEYEEEGWKKMAEGYAGHELKPSEISNFWIIKSLEFAAAEPTTFIKLTLKKMLLLIHRFGYGANYSTSYAYQIVPLLNIFPSFWFISIIGLAGMIVAPRKRKNMPFYLIVGAYALTLIASHVVHRYRLPLATVYLPFTGYVFSEIVKQVNREKLGALVFPSIIIFTIVILSIIPLKASGTMIDDMYNSFGLIERQNGNLDTSKKYYEKALEVNKNHKWARTNLAEVYAQEGDYTKAVELFRKSLSENPDNIAGFTKLKLLETAQKESPDPQAVVNQMASISETYRTDGVGYNANFQEGMTYLKKRNFKSAVEQFERTKWVKPTDPILLTNLATAYKNNNDIQKAQETFKKAIEVEPYNAIAYYNYGNLLSDIDKPKAVEAYIKADTILPGFMLASYYAGTIELSEGNREKALQYLVRFIEEAKEDPDKKDYVDKAKALLSQAIGTQRTR